MAEYTFHPSVSQHADTRSSRASTEGRETVERALRDHEGLIHAVIRLSGPRDAASAIRVSKRLSRSSG